MKGAFARGLHWWIIRAAISLPTPGGPEISTRLPVGATRFRVARTVLIATELPWSWSSCPTCWRRVSFSRRSRSVSVARSTR